MRAVAVLFALGAAFLVFKVVQIAGRVDVAAAAPPTIAEEQQIDASVARLNDWFRKHWEKEGANVAEPADDLTVFRRLSLSLFGAVPSLEDIRTFDADTQPDRIDRWVVQMLQDSRYSDYFAERLARSLVGVEQGAFIVFRRDRLTSWLAQQLRNDASWTEMTRELIAAEGLWTDQPAANFITMARIDDEGLDENKLAGRSVRTFLGQRIDCAQCHDHPFDPEWKQADFEGLAAFFGQAAISLGGVTDYPLDDEKHDVVYKVTDPGMSDADARTISAAVPFHSEWLPSHGGLRHRLADWITHKDNRRFERAIANRMWGFMFGKPLHEPVDDLPHPVDGERDALDILGAEFRAGDGRLSTLTRMIALSDVFRLSSESTTATDEDYAAQIRAWSVFPLVRLRPEQVIGSLFQAGHIRNIDQNSNPLIRVQKFGSENDFLNEYGDLGDDELLQQVGTIPQALLRMNGRFTADLSKVDMLTAANQILNLSPDDRAVVENSYLACLCRRPTDEERRFFMDGLSSGKPAEENESKTSKKPIRDRAEIMQDLFWTLFNSPEFSWNH